MGWVFSTVDELDRDRKAVWQEFVCKTFAPANVDFPDVAPFAGKVTCNHLGALHVGTADAGAQRIVRTKRKILEHPEEHVLVTLLGQGSGVIAQRGREALLGPGDLVFYDTIRPFSAGFGDTFTATCFRIPRHLFPLPTRILERISGVRIQADDGIGRLVSPFLRTLAAEADTYVDASDMGTSAVELLSAAARQIAGDVAVAEDRRPAVLSGIRSLIEQRLTDPELRPELIARAFGISTRYLHVLFAGQDTTVSGWIRQRRLEACRRELGRPGSTQRTVASIANQWGFRDAAYFSRLFRANYGVSPREWRATASLERQER